MVVFLWIAGAVLLGALMTFTAWASIVGGLAAVSDSRYERCPRCGHHGLVQQGGLHDGGCPQHHHAWATLKHRV